MNLLITICARGGSKGIPGKNVKSLNGIPLMGYSIKHAQAFAKETQADIALSTEDDAIVAVAAEYGLQTDYRRPKELATDSAGKLPVIRDVVMDSEKNGKKYDLILDLDVTSPMRTLEDLREATEMLMKNVNALNIFSVNPARRHPSFNMVRLSADGFAELIDRPTKQIESRQEAPKVFDLNASFYFYKRAFFDRDPLTLIDHSLLFEMQHPCFDLDEPVDFEFLEFLVKNKKLSFAI